MSRRRFVRLAGLALVGGGATTLLAACGGGGGAPAKPAESKPAESKPADAKPTESKPAEAAKPADKQGGPAAKAKEGASLKILVWSHFVPAYDEWLDNY